MAITALIVLAFAHIAAAQSPVEAGPLRPDCLANWLRIIEVPDFRLIAAFDQKGHYFAIKQDADGDLLFCKHEYRLDGDRNPRSFDLTVTDAKGDNLLHARTSKRNPESVKIMYQGKADGVTYAILYPAGTILPLREHKLQQVGVRYAELLDDGSQKVYLEQTIQLNNSK